jgi:CopG family transcriptional regulator/antitoxin EndoAI
MTVYRRINITLPEETVRLIDRVAKKGDRSFLISEAVQRYVASVGKARLRRLLKEGSLRNAERDLQLAQEWCSLDETLSLAERPSQARLPSRARPPSRQRPE